ncbi:MAG: response regulator [Planctomycetota bacterium]|nr:MAG: response regulator [Planctomycetota bacterium]
MSERTQKILVVEPDAEILEILVASLSRRFDAHITCVSDAVSCLDVEVVEPHDLIISEIELEGEDGLQLARQLMSLSARPVILMAEDLSTRQAVEALRLRVWEILEKPFPVDELLESAERAMHGFELRRRRAARYRRMRELVRRVIQERRHLKQRMELVCQDFVGAHKRLVQRVAALEQSRTAG